MATHPAVYVDFLNGPDTAELAMTNDEILAAVKTRLGRPGPRRYRGEPRLHHMPGVANGHLNVLRGYVGEGIGLSGVRVVGDVMDNFEQGLPAKRATLPLMNPTNGMPVAILDAAGIAHMRTGTGTAIGAKYLAGRGFKVLGHIGARGTAYLAVRLLDHLFDLDEIRVHSRRLESREPFAARLEADLGQRVTVCTDLGPACVSPTSSSKPRASPPPRHSSRPCGSSPARSSCHTAP